MIRGGEKNKKYLVSKMFVLVLSKRNKFKGQDMC